MHEMSIIGSADGVEEWLCSDCSRRCLIRWRPEFSRIVVEYGDNSARHVGSKGGVRLSVGSVQSNQSTLEISQSLSAEARQWLADNGIAWGQ